MKKLVSVVVSFALLCSLAACGKANAPAATPTPEPVATEVPAPAETPAPAAPESGSDATPAQQLLAAFKAQMSDGADHTTDEIAENFIADESLIPFAGATMPVEEGYLNGFSEEISGFAEGTMFAPMIGSIPFMGYVFRLEDGADVEAFMQQLKDKADLRWNICTEADEMVCEAEGSTVFFVMAPATFEE